MHIAKDQIVEKLLYVTHNFIAKKQSFSIVSLLEVVVIACLPSFMRKF